MNSTEVSNYAKAHLGYNEQRGSKFMVILHITFLIRKKNLSEKVQYILLKISPDPFYSAKCFNYFLFLCFS